MNWHKEKYSVVVLTTQLKSLKRIPKRKCLLEYLEAVRASAMRRHLRDLGKFSFLMFSYILRAVGPISSCFYATVGASGRYPENLAGLSGLFVLIIWISPYKFIHKRT